MKRKVIVVIGVWLLIVLLMWATGFSSPNNMRQTFWEAIFTYTRDRAIYFSPGGFEKYKLRYISKKNVPDLRRYTTEVLRFNKYTVFRHTVNFGNGTLLNTGGIVLSEFHKPIRNHFMDEYLYAPKAFARKYKLSETSKFKGGFMLEKYDIHEAAIGYEKDPRSLLRWAVDLDDLGFKKHLQVLKDKNRLVWVSDRGSLLDVKKTKKGYIVLSDIGVEYISSKKGGMESDFYPKAFCGSLFTSEAWGKLLPIASGRILTDNIVRIEYQDGYITHWRVKLKKKDCDKNMNIKKTSFEYGIAKVNGSVIWHNGKVTTEDLYPHKAWDMDTNTSVEPVYPE